MTWRSLPFREVLERIGRLFLGPRGREKLRGPEPTHHLPDGTPVIVRPLVPSDAEAMAKAFARLSSRSRYQRFLSAVDRLSPAELEYLSRVDGDRHLALGMAVIEPDAPTPVPIAIVRCIREAEDPETAEVAAIVADEWQGRGVGRLLLGCLAEQARAVGICRWKAVMLAENDAARRLLEGVGPLVSRRMEGPGVVELVYALVEHR